jgi:hypothetical protein
MKPSRPWRSRLCLLGVIVAAALSGALLGHRAARRQFEVRTNPENWNEHVSREFDRIVKPTPEQAVIIQAHLDRAVGELQTIRLDTIARSTNVIWRLVEEVERELTAEQRRAFAAMKPKPAELTLDVLKLKTKKSETAPAKP